MTQEQYERAIQINDRLKELGKVKCEIEDKDYTFRLSFIKRSSNAFNAEYKPCSEYLMKYIGKIFDIHENKIRAEIDEEMRALEKEIESL